MRLYRGYALGLATLGGVAIAGCNLALGLGGYDFTQGAGGATSSSSGGGSTSSTSTSSNGGGGATSSSTGGSGGTGGGPECSSPSTCPDVPPGPCASLGQKVCNAGKCGVAYTAGDAPSQKYGSCKMTICDASGTAIEVVDDTNLYDDGNPCTQEKCTSGVPSSADLFNSQCTLGQVTGVCLPDLYVFGWVACAECDPTVSPSTCSTGTTCVKGKCVADHCKNGSKDSGESDIDCGGPSSGCLKCPDDKSCQTANNCASGVCPSSTLKCAAPTCMDNVKNQNESDVDCGGKCSPCADTAGCIVAADCQSKVCQGNVCQAPTCADGVQNGDETGLDCGGTACPPCAP